MAFPLTPVNGQQYEEATSGRRWTYSTASSGWIPEDINVLDELSDVSTLSNLTKGGLVALLVTTAGTNPAIQNITNVTLGYPRQSFRFASYVELQDITVGLDYDPSGTSGLLRLEIYRSEQLTLDTSDGNWPLVQFSLGDPVLTSNSIEAITAQGAAVFTFQPNNILEPLIPYTFVIRKDNLDAPMFLTSFDTTIDGQYGADAARDIGFFAQGFELTGTPQTNDVLKFDVAGGSLWESQTAYPTGGFVPIQVEARDPAPTDVFNAGVFWRSTVSEQAWISRGGGLWWPLPPLKPQSSSPVIAIRSDTSPAAPYDGQLWFSNLSAKLFMYDAEATAWLEV